MEKATSGGRPPMTTAHMDKERQGQARGQKDSDTVETEFLGNKKPTGFQQGRPAGTCGCPTVTRRWGRVVVGASFLAFLLHIGVLGTFGAFLPILLEEFQKGSGKLGWVVSSGIAVENFAGPIGNFVVRKIGCRPAVMLGGVLLALGTATASFATSVYHLFVCIGLVAGLGGAITHVSIIVAVGEFYNRHYTMANGIAYAGPGAGMFILPPIIQYLNENYGWRGSLLIEAAIVSNVIVLGALFRPSARFKSRPCRSVVVGNCDGEDKSSDSGISEVSTETDAALGERYSEQGIDDSEISTTSQGWELRARRKSIFNQTFTPAILAVFAACVFHTAGYSGVSVHLVNQAISSGMSPRQASILLSCIGLGSLVGRLSHGWFLTRKLISASGMYTLSLLVSVVATATLPQTTTLAGKITCATTVGICSGVYFSLVAVLLRELVGLLYLGVAFGVSLFCSGVGTTLGGYVIGVLRDVTGSYYTPSYLICAFFGVAAIASVVHPTIQWYRAHRRRPRNIPVFKALSDVTN